METEPYPTPGGTQLLSPQEVAARLKVSRAMAYKLLSSRAIPLVRIGRSVRVRECDLEAYILKMLSPE